MTRLYLLAALQSKRLAECGHALFYPAPRQALNTLNARVHAWRSVEVAI